ncbi:Remorin family protein [Striga hermonthica]|uniref:Remorin family protein n=1 Tax=Striga hermonthica TaxID=68872 RepID=A0A9N7NQV8_STRHE|nr:Remorin family protein [Striga hermonthica]
MRNYGSSFRNSGPYTSPGTPEYGLNSSDDKMPKTWSSERVPLPISSRRHTAALMPFSSGRAPPSKWDDAERWITSPISGHGGFLRSPVAQAHYRRPKSKSGPLGPAGPGAFEGGGGTARRFAVTNSPLTTGVLVPERVLAVGYGSGPGVKPGSLYCEGGNSLPRCGSGPGLSDLASEGSLPSSRDGKMDGSKEDEGQLSRRDMATQMSSQGSNRSSSMGRLSFSNLSRPIPTSEKRGHENPSAKDEIRDVQVDKGTTTITRHPKKKGHKKKEKEKGSSNVEGLNSWNVAEPSKDISKLQREEAKITAWENLQKAKAEAAIRKLEMKLEKKRSASMDRIMNKVKGAHAKAQAMRDLLSDQPPRPSGKGFCIYIRICSSCTCFLCSKR